MKKRRKKKEEEEPEGTKHTTTRTTTGCSETPRKVKWSKKKETKSLMY